MFPFCDHKCEYLTQGMLPNKNWWYCKMYKIFLSSTKLAYDFTALRHSECVSDEREKNNG